VVLDKILDLVFFAIANKVVVPMVERDDASIAIFVFKHIRSIAVMHDFDKRDFITDDCAFVFVDVA
jgi:hypothetical protein